jgi:hypothetical protein
LTLIVCVDDRGGLSFNGRRQSRDQLLLADLLAEADGHRLWMNEYSARLFPDEVADRLLIAENPLDRAVGSDCCFIENLPVQPFLEQADRLLLYHWNRTYPADRALTLPLDGGWTLLSQEEFPGFSHEKITKEHYER